MTESVILLGKGEQAFRIAHWFRRSRRYELRCVVPVIPEPSWTESLVQWCQTHGVAHVESGHYEDIPCIEADNWRVDLLLSVFYDKILPIRLLNKASRSLNLHNGPLPRYRGIAPINWALKNCETMHGVTIHEITPRVDAGPIVSQVLFSIYPARDEVIDVYERALAYGYTLFEQTMPLLDHIEPVPQREAEMSHYTMQDLVLLGERSDFTKAQSQ